MRYRTLLLCAGAFALAGTSAVAQAAQETAASSDQDETSAGQLTSQIDDIVVTAQRRSERLLTVPIAVSALGEQQLAAQGVKDMESVALGVPGVVISRSINSATPFVRGIGSPSGAAGEEGSTAVYVDGVYSTNQFSNAFNLNNVASIEILKGPQGTLFGRNAAAGAILVNTKAPSHGFNAETSIGYGNYDTTTASLYVNGGLTETLAANLAVQGSDQGEAWGHSEANGIPNGQDRFFSGRARLLWTPRETTRVTLSADHYRQKNSIGAAYFGLNAFGVAQPKDFYDFQSTFESSSDVISQGLSLRVEQEFEHFDLASTTAYRRMKSRVLSDFDRTPFDLIHFDPLVTKDNAVQQDLQIQSKQGAPVDWTVGAFLLDDKAGYVPGYTRGLGSPTLAGQFTDVVAVQHTQSYAVYGQATMPFLDAVWSGTRLTLGARYSVDDRSVDGVQRSSIPSLNLATTAEARYPSSTWRVSLDHQFTSDIMAYVSYNTGYKSGVFNLNAFWDPPVKPEKIEAFEVGTKARLFDGMMQVEVAAYHYDRSQIQLRQTLASGITQLLNAASGRSYGVDFSVQARPTQNLVLTGAVSLVSTEYTSFPGAPYLIPRPGTCLAGTTGTPTGGNIACVGDATGNNFIQAPPVTANIGVSYTIPLTAGEVVINGAYSYNDGFYWEPDNRLKQDAYSNLNASVAWTLPDDRWTLQAWARNLTATERFALVSSSTAGDQGTPAPPRTFGVTLTRRFGE